ncbi:hypothetical protein CLOSPO_00220 [Clostridium sporogenes ATCC 15579]|jgi:hypothetical protein|nr:hypothetical protein CLOSPO_00220 [Clostridium sporogenes ATCC 15579]
MVLSSVAQQEVENISANVKKGLKMKVNLGYVTKYGSSTWASSTILGIIKNEKYKSDLLLGKTFTVDPISKLDKDIESIEGKKSKLVDMRLEYTIDKASYEVKYSSFTEKQEQLLKERGSIFAFP